MLLTPKPASAQTLPPPTTGDDGAPYGGVQVATGSLPSPSTDPTGMVKRHQNDDPQTSSTACPSGAPCVLTGQNSRYRTSVNVNESTLGNYSNWSQFGIAAFYALPNPPGDMHYEAMAGQPLYITEVGSSTGPNLLIAATLAGNVYAFDTSTGSTSTLWTTNPIPLPSNDCPSGAPFDNNLSHEPGAANLPYYGAVTTPVIDVASADPVLYVTSACVNGWKSGYSTFEWYLNAIDVATGTLLAKQQIEDTTGGFTPYNELSRGSLLLTHPTSTTTYVYVEFGAGLGELKAATSSSPATTSPWSYSGVLFAYPIIYTNTGGFGVTIESPVMTPSTANAFYTSCATGTACAASSSFPSTYNSYTAGSYSAGIAPLGPTAVPSNTYHTDYGDNWAVSGAGMWSSNVGPSSTGSANVYATAGNGPFACNYTGSSQNSCLDSNTIYYHGNSAMQFPPGNIPTIASGSYGGGLSGTAAYCLIVFDGGNPTVPGTAYVAYPYTTGSMLTIHQAGQNYLSAPTTAHAATGQACGGTGVSVSTTLSSTSNALVPPDFFAPYMQRYTCPPATPDPPNSSCGWNSASYCAANGYNLYYADCAPAAYQTQEFSRMDLDFGTPGMVMLPQSNGNYFAVTADKPGFIYVTPTPEASPGSLGQFQPGDTGLNGTTLTYSTQPPFLASRYPYQGSSNPNAPNGTCPSSGTGFYNNAYGCDEIHELAWWYNLLFVWPIGEGIEVFSGSPNSTYTQYTFGTTPVFDPCPRTGSCTTGFPYSNFASQGTPMSIAVNSTSTCATESNMPPTPCGTLFGMVPQSSAAVGAWGSLFAYGITTTSTGFGTLTYDWDSVSNTTNCSGSGVTGWFSPSFAQPTLAGSSASGDAGAYVSAVCTITGTWTPGSADTCDTVPSAHRGGGGILFFGACS